MYGQRRRSYIIIAANVAERSRAAAKARDCPCVVVYDEGIGLF